MIFQLRELAKAGKAHVELCVCDESSCDLVLHRVEANNDSSAGMDLPSSFRKKIAETLYADVCCGNAVAMLWLSVNCFLLISARLPRWQSSSLTLVQAFLRLLEGFLVGCRFIPQVPLASKGLRKTLRLFLSATLAPKGLKGLAELLSVLEPVGVVAPCR